MTTSNGEQTIATLNNLNMNGSILESSTEHLLNIHTATITYDDTALISAANLSTITLYDGTDGEAVTFTMVTGTPSGTQFQQITNSDTTATNLPIPYQEFSDNAFELFPMVSATTVNFSVVAIEGKDTISSTC